MSATQAGSICSICGDSFSQFLSCVGEHIFCQECIEGSMNHDPLSSKKFASCVCPAFGCSELLQIDCGAATIIKVLKKDLEEKVTALAQSEERVSNALDASMKVQHEAAAAEHNPEEKKSFWVRRFERNLTLECPGCRLAFVDYNGCNALECANKLCGVSFCAICMYNSGVIEQRNGNDDCHEHIRRMHGDVFDKQAFINANKARVIATVRTIFEKDLDKFECISGIALKLSDVSLREILKGLFPEVAFMEEENKELLQQIDAIEQKCEIKIRHSHREIRSIERAFLEQQKENEHLKALLEECIRARDVCDVRNEALQSQIEKLTDVNSQLAKEETRTQNTAAEEVERKSTITHIVLNDGYRMVRREVCAYGPNCTIKGCKIFSGLFHQSHCRYGLDCAKENCTYYHELAGGKGMGGGKGMNRGKGMGGGKGIGGGKGERF